MTDTEDHSWAQQVYIALAHLGIDPGEMVANYEDKDGRVIIACPKSKIGIAVEGDQPGKLGKKGWTIYTTTIGQLSTFSKVLESLTGLSFTHRAVMSGESMIKTGSKEERALLEGILRAGLPEPDRNYTFRREDGRELTVPDFTWPSERIAFFVDGLWWHRTKDDSEMMAAIKGGEGNVEKHILDANQSRAERDADNRSEVSAMGWTVLSCTDRDLGSAEGVQNQVDRIRKVIRQKREQRAKLAEVLSQEGVDSDDLLDLL